MIHWRALTVLQSTRYSLPTILIGKTWAKQFPSQALRIYNRESLVKPRFRTRRTDQASRPGVISIWIGSAYTLWIWVFLGNLFSTVCIIFLTNVSLQMIYSVQFRKTTFLNSEKWRTTPWKHAKKDALFRLWEHGFDFGAAIEVMDKSRAQGSLNPTDTLQFLHQFQKISNNMDLWLQKFLAESPNAMQEAKYPKPLAFQSVPLATTYLTYCSLKLVVTYVMHTVGVSVTASSANVRDLQNFWQDDSFGDVLERHTTAHCLELSTTILRAMPYMLRDDMGLMAAQHAMFPLRVALFYLTRHGGEELEWCRQVYNLLSSKKGLRHAEKLSQQEGGYRGDLNSSEAERESWRRQQSSADK